MDGSNQNAGSGCRATLIGLGNTWRPDGFENQPQYEELVALGARGLCRRDDGKGVSDGATTCLPG